MRECSQKHPCKAKYCKKPLGHSDCHANGETQWINLQAVNMIKPYYTGTLKCDVTPKCHWMVSAYSIQKDCSGYVEGIMFGENFCLNARKFKFCPFCGKEIEFEVAKVEVNHAPNGDVFAGAPGMNPHREKKYSGGPCLFQHVPMGAVAVFPKREILKWSTQMNVKIENVTYDDRTPCNGWYWAGDVK